MNALWEKVDRSMRGDVGPFKEAVDKLERATDRALAEHFNDPDFHQKDQRPKTRTNESPVGRVIARMIREIFRRDRSRRRNSGDHIAA